MINFKDIDNLERDKQQDNLYDLYITTFINNKSINVYGYVVQKGEGMRIDKICRKIYNNEEHLSFILNINDILNSLNIKNGDLLLYVDEKNINAFIPSKIEKRNIRDSIISKMNKNKKQQIDKSRKDYVNVRKSSDQLPPNIKDKAGSPIKVEGGLIKIIK